MRIGAIRKRERVKIDAFSDALRARYKHGRCARTEVMMHAPQRKGRQELAAGGGSEGNTCVHKRRDAVMYGVAVLLTERSGAETTGSSRAQCGMWGMEIAQRSVKVTKSTPIRGIIKLSFRGTCQRKHRSTECVC